MKNVDIVEGVTKSAPAEIATEASPHAEEEQGQPQRVGRRPLPSREAVLLAAIVEFGSISEGSVRSAQTTIDRYGSFAAVLNAPAVELCEDEFIRNGGAENIAIARNVILQTAYTPLRNLPIMDNADTLIRYLLMQIGRAEVECIHLLCLNVKSHLLFDERIAQGSNTFVHTTASKIMHHAARNDARSIVIAHNHPSGDPQPSADDILFTARIANACDIMGIQFLDHIIVAGGRWYSFKQSGII